MVSWVQDSNAGFRTIYARTIKYLTRLATGLEPVTFDLGMASVVGIRTIVKQPYFALPTRLAIHGLFLLHDRFPGLQAVYADLRPRHCHHCTLVVHDGGRNHGIERSDPNPRTVSSHRSEEQVVERSLLAQVSGMCHPDI